jgi:DNA primase
MIGMPGGFSVNTLDQIRAASDIVDVIGACLPLKRAGTVFLTHCPFHKEKTPSFNVNPQKQFFYCFGCHKGGDVFSFVQEYDKVDFGEAVRRLAERAHSPLEFDADGGQQTRHAKEILWDLHEQVAQRWQIALANDAAGQVARDYLSRRRVPEEAVKLFRLGYAPEAWDDTVNWAKAKGFDLAHVEQAGLILRKEGESHYYDRFRGRLIFPICDEQGRVAAFSGRILSDEVKAAKYVNSPETPIFAKRKVFYGLDKSKRAILDAQFAIVCEGQLDLIACFMAGIKNIVAPQGTAFTADHARLLKRYVNEVVLCFDSDLAGQSAAVRVLDDLLACELAIRVAAVPSPHDPDSYIKAFGGPAFQKLIENAEGFFDFYLRHLCAKNDPSTDKGRIEIVQAMGTAVRKTGNAVLADIYAQKTAMRLQVSPQAVSAQFAKVPSPKSTHGTAEETESLGAPAATNPSPKEFWLLKYLFLEGSDMAWVASNLDLQWLEHATVRQIVEALVAAHTEQRWRGVAAFLGELPGEEAKRLLSEALSDPRPIPNPQQQLADTLLWFRNRALDRQIAELLTRIGNSSLSEAERLQIPQQQQTLRRLKQQPLAPLPQKTG